MRLTSAGPAVLLLLCSLLAGSTDAQRQELRALVGSDVELGCSHRQAGDFDLRDLYVYWQAGGPNGTLSVACHLGDSSQCQEAQYPDPEYRHRARLEPERMRRGDFSLILRRVGPQDEQAFRCVVLRNSLGMDRVVDTTVSLHVAANFSMPVVHASRGPAPGELTFTCVSTDGYPRPKVHWINRTDGSALDQALHNSSVTRNVRGLYDVVSVLRLSRTGRVDVGCCVENDRLCQNLTVGGWADVPTPEGSRHTEGPPPEHSSGSSASSALAVAVPLAVALAAGVAVGCTCRSRLLRGRYAGAQAAQLELGLAARDPRMPSLQPRPPPRPSRTTRRSICSGAPQGRQSPHRRPQPPPPSPRPPRRRPGQPQPPEARPPEAAGTSASSRPGPEGPMRRWAGLCSLCTDSTCTEVTLNVKH